MVVHATFAALRLNQDNNFEGRLGYVEKTLFSNKIKHSWI